MKSVILQIGTIVFTLLITFSCRDLFGDGTQPESIVQPPSEGSKIVVTDPLYGTIFSPGDTIVIRWIAPTIESIDLQLFRKSNYKITLAENIQNEGYFIWRIPSNFTFSHHYRIKVISNRNSDIYEFTEQFGIL
jgi:2-keto-4-pentenoate hydratase